MTVILPITSQEFNETSTLSSAPFTAGNTTESKTSQPAQTYAPPPGPPPGVRESYDHPPAKPELPSRGSMSRAQPDDLEDVKKVSPTRVVHDRLDGEMKDL